tara:strand:- start:82 stop:453 length:372 start_codon:yes stop_codon:yes gene_type:complete
MKIKDIENIMKKYGEAWEKQDSKLILECFTENGVYQESPLNKPYRGHDEIKKFWDRAVVKNTRNIKFKLGKCYVSKDVGFCEWECKNEHRYGKEWRKDHMVGIMILKFSKGKIKFLNEYWCNG